ncbi:hypothetical protein J7643_02695 [bacterium]|nr:hypothetical protein [bacterium]
MSHDNVLNLPLEILDDVLAEGALIPLGAHEAGWDRPNAKAVLDALAGTDVAVLGGDVWDASGTYFKLTYDNWYCVRVSDEPFQLFSRRSREAAYKFIDGYREPMDRRTLYILVFADERQFDALEQVG